MESSKNEASLDDRIKAYVKPESPLGPSDESEIKDPEVAAKLFDPHNFSFNSLLRKDLSIIVGRRGSGKTALLNSYLYRKYIGSVGRGRVRDDRYDFDDYDVVISIKSHELFENMQSRVVGADGVKRPIESIRDDWERIIVDYMLASIVEQATQDELNSVEITEISAYLESPELRRRLGAIRDVWRSLPRLWPRFGRRKSTRRALPTRDSAVASAIAYLKRRGTGAMLIFDSMDEYEVNDERMDRAVGALLRFVGQFNRQYERMKIKLALPEEILPEIRKSSANALKDLVTIDRVRWDSIELAQIAAHRFRIFLRLYDPSRYSSIRGIDLNQRADVHAFWGTFFNEDIENRYGEAENALTYMLRHTQLLPRQFFMILSNTILKSQRITGGYRYMLAEAVTSSIAETEETIAEEIFAAYKFTHPQARDLGRAIFGNFPSVFDYDAVEDRWRKFGRGMMKERIPHYDLVNMMEMLINMGILGEIAEETPKYFVGNFAYNRAMGFNPGSGSQLCVHPIFSKYFGCTGNLYRKPVLPRGATIPLGFR